MIPWLNISSTAPETPLGVSANGPEHDEAHLGERGVRDQPLQVAFAPHATMAP